MTQILLSYTKENHIYIFIYLYFLNFPYLLPPKKTTKFVETNQCLGFCQGLFFLRTYVRVEKTGASRSYAVKKKRKTRYLSIYSTDDRQFNVCKCFFLWQNLSFFSQKNSEVLVFPCVNSTQLCSFLEKKKISNFSIFRNWKKKKLKALDNFFFNLNK